MGGAPCLHTQFTVVGRLVGIVSHVEELKGIDVRLEVQHGLRGSTARFFIP